MKVFKFGGGILRTGKDLIRLIQILRRFENEKIIIVVSAFNKVTNKLEELLNDYFKNKKLNQDKFDELINFHFSIIQDAFIESQIKDVENIIQKEFEELEHLFSTGLSQNYHYEYDKIVSYGELISSKIIFELLKRHFNCKFEDIRNILITDSNFTEAKVNWELSNKNIREKCTDNFSMCITQGFIAADKDKQATTLGREGSDFTAAVLAYSVDAEQVVFWKEVDGIYNADPTQSSEYTLIPKLSYKEAVEQAFYGAKILHPKTIKPLQNKQIPIIVKSFYNEHSEGTLITDISELSKDVFPNVPVFITKENQILISVSTKDFSFISEENFGRIFTFLSELRIKVNLMESSAISFSFCVTNDKFKIPKLILKLKIDFNVLYNDDLDLVTIRHYDNESIVKMTSEREILINQKSRQTARYVLR